MTCDVVDAIYEAAIIGEQWPALLDRVRADTRSVIGLLLTRDAEARVAAITNPGMEHVPAEYDSLNLFSRSIRMPRALAAMCNDFVADDDFLTEEERRTDPGYTEFLYPRGWGHGTAMSVRFPDSSAVILNFERTRAAGRFERETLAYLNTLRPHFGRALSLRRSAELRRAKDRVDALEALGIAAMALGGGGRVLALNAAMEGFVPDVVADRRGRAVFSSRPVDQRFQDILAAGGRSSVTMPIRREPFPIVAHLLPVVREARDVFSLTTHILLLMPVRPGGAALSPDVIQILFDLTPAEARTAYALAGGATVADIAGRQAVSRETVRSHVKNVMRKTLTSRQADLVSLLSSGVVRAKAAQEG